MNATQDPISRVFLTSILMMSFALAATAQDSRPVAKLRISYLDEAPVDITPEQFSKLPRTQVEAKDKDGKTVTYSGVAVHHLLAQTQTPAGETLRAGALRCYATVEAKDGYRVVFALPEFDPAFTDRIILVADQRNAQPLDERSGPYQMILPDEKRQARWVRMVEHIRILESPEPTR